MAKKRNTQHSIFTVLIGTIIIVLITIIFRVLFFAYDVITIYTTKYKQKSGNGFFKTYFNKGNYGEFELYRKIVRLFGKKICFY